jgi:hypothetical protein
VASAAGLLAAGLLLLVSGWLALAPGWLARLRAPSGQADEDEAVGDEEAAWSRSGGIPDPIARLAPLTVLDGSSPELGGERELPPQGGRILPPT